MLGTQASGTEVEAFLFTVYIDRNRVNIRHPATLGMALGMTDIMTKLRGLPTQIALQYFFSLTNG